MQTYYVNGNSMLRWLYKDNLGSVIAIANDSGKLVKRFKYDVFGQQEEIIPTKQERELHYELTFASVLGLAEISSNTRGYTGHEPVFFDNGGDGDKRIIHMNGRMYDASLGRMLQADPVVQAPNNLQNYNAYTYVLNNPLAYTDPSGYFIAKLRRGLIKEATRVFGKDVVNIVGGIASSIVCGPAAAACAAAWSYDFSRAMGVNPSDALRGAAIAGASVYAFQKIGEYFSGLSGSNVAGAQGSGDFARGMGFDALGDMQTQQAMGELIHFGSNYLTSGQVAGQIFSHAMVGGIASELGGGKFGHGFWGAGVSKGAGTSLNTHYNNGIVSGTIINATVGGTSSWLSGGKFANGAITGAYQALYNHYGKKPRRGGGRPELTVDQALYMKENAGFHHFWKSNGDISLEGTACFGPCYSLEAEYTDSYGLSGAGALASEWGFGSVMGGGADFEVYTSRDVNIFDGSWTPTRSFGGQFGFIGVTTTRYESIYGGHLTTNIELNFRWPGGLSVHGGSGVKKW